MSQIKGDDNLRSDVLRGGKSRADGTWLHHWPVRRHTKRLCQNNNQPPVHMTNYQVFTLELVLVGAVCGWNGGQGAKAPVTEAN